MPPSERDINLAVGDYFRRARESLGWTLQDVTDRAKTEGASISLSALSRVERGLAGLSLAEAIALCRALGTRLRSVEEIVRAARANTQVDLSKTDYDGLMRDGQKQFRRGDFAKALQHFDAARDWLALRKDRESRPNEEAEATLWVAECHRRQRSFGMAQESAVKLLNMPGCREDYKTRALILQVAISYLSGDLYGAGILARSLEPRLADCPAGLRAFGYGTIGGLHIERGEYEEAGRRFETVARLYEELGDNLQLARAHATWGYCLTQTGEFERGAAMLEGASELALSHEHFETAALALRYLGRAKVQQGLFESARTDLESAASLARKVSRQNDLFLAWFAIWKLERERGEAARESHARTVLSRLLRKVDPSMSEVTEFLSDIAPPAPPRRVTDD